MSGKGAAAPFFCLFGFDAGVGSEPGRARRAMGSGAALGLALCLLRGQEEGG